MSVFINGMEMPKSCMLCNFCVPEADEANGEMCMVTGKLMPPCNHERLDDCPLTPVPPHGRLIDADAVAKMVLGSVNQEDAQGFIFTKIICQILKDAPTIIPAESITAEEEKNDK